MTVKYGEWDRYDLEWFHRNPQTFDFVRKHSAEFYKTQRIKRQFKVALIAEKIIAG
jgi:hypothetical protein